MSNGDKKRVSRIKRIFQDNDKDSDTWVDVERIVELWVATGREGVDRQERHYVFDWDDKNWPKEQTAKKKIYDPNDDSTFIEIPIRSGVTVDGSGSRYQKYIHYFGNGKSNKTRRTHSRKIYHYDIDERFLREGQPPSKPEEYIKLRKNKDKDQYVVVEILEEYAAPARAGRDMHGRSGFTGLHGKSTPGHWQNRVWQFEGSSLLEEGDQEALTGINNPAAGPTIDPPWRIDPLQAIVNVNWGGLAVIFGERATDAPKQDQGK